MGCETALYLKNSGAENVCVVEVQDTLAPKAIFTYRMALLQQLEQQARAYTGSRCLEITKTHVRIEDCTGAEQLLPADAVVYAVGTAAVPAEAFLRYTPTGRLLGDCLQPGNIYTATRGAYEAAMQVL